MKFELGLLSNSYDYIYNSFDLYYIANEHGIHDAQRVDIKNKMKWKLAFVSMVQAVELLLKEGLYRIHPNLIYENIDCDNRIEKTVTFQQAINRINNLNNNLIDINRKKFLINCAKIRNDYIHYKVSVESEKIKAKYCMLYFIYKELHSELIKREIDFYDKSYKNIDREIIEYNRNWTVFRGFEFLKTTVEVLKNEINENRDLKYYITKDDKKVERIIFGTENEFSNWNPNGDLDICHDCCAKRGEYHLSGCDSELCPICHEQVISCSCIKVDEDDELMTSID